MRIGLGVSSFHFAPLKTVLFLYTTSILCLSKVVLPQLMFNLHVMCLSENTTEVYLVCCCSVDGVMGHARFEEEPSLWKVLMVLMFSSFYPFGW